MELHRSYIAAQSGASLQLLAAQSGALLQLQVEPGGAGVLLLQSCVDALVWRHGSMRRQLHDGVAFSFMTSFYRPHDDVLSAYDIVLSAS
jgi:hypothetical protein